MVPAILDVNQHAWSVAHKLQNWHANHATSAYGRQRTRYASTHARQSMHDPRKRCMCRQLSSRSRPKLIRCSTPHMCNVAIPIMKKLPKRIRNSSDYNHKDMSSPTPLHPHNPRPSARLGQRKYWHIPRHNSHTFTQTYCIHTIRTTHEAKRRIVCHNTSCHSTTLNN